MRKDLPDPCETYSLPDGTKLKLGEELHRCTEKLFTVGLDNDLVVLDDVKNLHELVMESVEKCGLDMRRTLLQRIVLTGGNTLFKGTYSSNYVSCNSPINELASSF
jgi:hypothetical protein